MYQRFSKLNRQQRARVGPQYYEAYDDRMANQDENDSILLSDIQEQNSSLNNLRQPYYVIRSRNDQMRRMRGVDNMGYLRTSNDPFLIDDINEHNSLQRSRPAVHHLPYNDKYVTVPKRTEILYIQSPMPVDERPEDVVRSISQNDMRFNEEQTFDSSTKVPQHTHSIIDAKQTDGFKANSLQKQRQVSFNNQIVSDMTIPEEVVVPGMVQTDGQLKHQSIAGKSNAENEQTFDQTNDEQRMVTKMDSNEDNQKLDDSLDKAMSSSQINDDNKYNRSDFNVEIDPNSENRVGTNFSRGSLHSSHAIDNTPYEEQIQITSISGVPVSIELTNKPSTKMTNNMKSRKNLLKKDNSSENSDKSYDSDSGIGRSGLNTQIDFDMKNGGLLEKKSVFTIAYNDVKTRQLQSAGSIGD